MEWLFQGWWAHLMFVLALAGLCLPLADRTMRRQRKVIKLFVTREQVEAVLIKLDSDIEQAKNQLGHIRASQREYKDEESFNAVLKQYLPVLGQLERRRDQVLKLAREYTSYESPGPKPAPSHGGGHCIGQRG